MPIDPTILCLCHREPMYRRSRTRCLYCHHVVRARWQQSNAKQLGSPAHRRSTTKANAARIYAGQRYIGLAQSAEQADVINAHVRRRRYAFKSGQRC